MFACICEPLIRIRFGSLNFVCFFFVFPLLVITLIDSSVSLVNCINCYCVLLNAVFYAPRAVFNIHRSAV